MNKEKIKTGIIGAIAGGVLTMIVGFSWGGWVSSTTAMEKGRVMAINAVAERLTPICIAQFNQDPEKVEKLAEFQATSSWLTEKYVQDQGWATIPFEKEPDGHVAGRCSTWIKDNSSS